MHPSRVGEPLPSDANLATRALAGDAAALAGLLERYRPSLYATAVGLLRNREDARDAVQEVNVVALARISSLRDPAAVGGWLHRVLRNVCLMRMRSQAPAVPRADVNPPGVVPSLDEAIERLVLRDWVWKAIGELAPDDRVTVMLRHFARSNSYAAIAALTDVPVGTVRSRLNRARPSSRPPSSAKLPTRSPRPATSNATGGPSGKGSTPNCTRRRCRAPIGLCTHQTLR